MKHLTGSIITSICSENRMVVYYPCKSSLPDSGESSASQNATSPVQLSSQAWQETAGSFTLWQGTRAACVPAFNKAAVTLSLSGFWHRNRYPNVNAENTNYAPRLPPAVFQTVAARHVLRYANWIWHWQCFRDLRANLRRKVPKPRSDRHRCRYFDKSNGVAPSFWYLGPISRSYRAVINQIPFI